jgi:hypothetical protein
MDDNTIYQRFFRIGGYYIAGVFIVMILRPFSPIVFKHSSNEHYVSLFLLLSVSATSVILVGLDYFKHRHHRYWPQSILFGITIAVLSILFTLIVGISMDSSKYRKEALYQHKYFYDQTIMLEEDYSNHKTRVVQVSDFTPWFQLVQKIDTLKINNRRWEKLK